MGHVARVGERRGAFTVLAEKSEGKRQLGILSIDGRIILNCVIKK